MTTAPSRKVKGWQLVKVLLWVVAGLVFVQDFTGILAGRDIRLRLGKLSSQNPNVLQLRPSGDLPLSGRPEKQIQMWQDGRRLRGPYDSIKALSAAGEGTFTSGRTLWANVYRKEGADPAAASYTARLPTVVPPWLSWPLYLSVIGFSVAPWTVRYYRDHPPSPAKVGYLESVRGLACLLVVSTHFCNIFLPTDNPAVMESQNPWGFAMLHREIPLVRLLTAGGYAVDVFFVLSGFVLSLPFLGRRTDINRRVPEVIVRRPVRLYGLVIAVMVICQLAFSSGHAYGGYFAPAKPWPSFLLDVANPYSTAVAYTVVFWTIQYELWGAFGVYVFMWALGGTRYRWLAYGIIFFLLKGELYQGFLFGVVLADLWHMCRMREPSAWVRRSAPLLLMLGLLLGSFAVQSEGHGAYDAWLTSWLPDVQGWVGGGYIMIGAVLTLASVLMSPAMQRWLSHAWLVALGRISFSIYAIHGLILITFCCWLFNVLHPGAAATRLYFQPDGASYGLHLMLVLLVYIPLFFAAAAWLTAAVDEPCVRLSHKFGRWTMRRSPAPSVGEQKETAVPTT